jgi:hypothetical protein
MQALQLLGGQRNARPLAVKSNDVMQIIILTKGF